jgi:stage V sporulation protein S
MHVQTDHRLSVPLRKEIPMNSTYEPPEVHRGSEVDIIRVSSSSRTASVAGAIAGVVRDNQDRTAKIQAIGASAVNQATKAIVLATDYLAQDGIIVAFVPEFVNVDINGKTRTAIRFNVGPR